MAKLERRLASLETDHFLLQQEVRKLSHDTERNANSLDEFEDGIEEVAQMTSKTTADLWAAMAKRQQRIEQEQAAADADADAQPQPQPAAEAEPEADSSGAQPQPAVQAQQQGHGQGPRQKGEPAQRPSMAVLRAWVRTHIAPMERRTTTTGEGGGLRWCRQWWRHPDAVERFGAIYMAYKRLRTEEDATWLSVYLRDHLDPHIATLTSPYGPFYGCSPNKHSTTTQMLGADEPAATAGPSGTL
ncbi:DUF4913 domain-containing protein [Pseudonocardiaceae bacterium YIM PH 21723]|nr:DUF4913 domain-containing protein [Pseudonocardiaceae bacterium YIM PH 21723]